ncbi:MAG: hypothetical protein JXB39_02470 [Deltaproteobacteria bacterium]|nr:hypothetical protein [Deltaproteobacteria bacterium]
MAETSTPLFVARETDIQALRTHLEAARAGDGRMVLLEAPFGGGHRALTGELFRLLASEADDVLLWRVAFTEEEDGLRTLLRLYATLFGLLHRTPLQRTRVEMVLNAQMPQHPKRVQTWFQSFIDGLHRGPKPGEETFQVGLPRDNPLLGMVEILHGIASKIPVVLEIQNVSACQSVSIYAFLEALLDVVRGHSRMLVILHSEPSDEVGRAWMPGPWTDLLERRAADLHRISLVPWGEEEVRAFLRSRGVEADAAALVQAARGLPGFVAEIVDFLEAEGRLSEIRPGMTLATLTPTAADEGEIEAEEKPEDAEGKRRRAGLADVPPIQHAAALLGHLFPSNILADMLGLERDSVDDVLDACSDLFAEQQFSEPLQSWLYTFKRPFFRFGVLEAHQTPEDRERALKVAGFMERFLAPRSLEFLSRTSRAYAEAGEVRRAAIIRNLALSGDRPEVWGMAHELIGNYDEVPWSDSIRKSVYMNLLDRMIQGGSVDVAERLFGEVMQWASSKGDRALESWVLFAGSRLDYRRQDLYRARDRARDALTLVEALEDRFRAAEIHNHLAMIELSDGNPNAALEQVRTAGERSDAPPIQAHGAFVRGLVARRDRKFTEAVEHFRKANEIAGAAGLGPLALEAAVSLGEALLASRQTAQAADVLTRSVQIAQALQNPLRERAAVALLAQAQAAQDLKEAALQSARRTLELTESLGLKQFVPVDTYNLGLFTFVAGNATEAVALFRRARDGVNPNDQILVRELHFNLGNALRAVGETAEARKALETALDLAQKTKDVAKGLRIREILADLSLAEGDKDAARSMLNAALAEAEAAELREDRKNLKRKLEGLR